MRKGAGIIAVALLVVTAACGGGGGDEKARKSEPTTTVAQRNQEPTTTVAQRNQEFALGERAQFTSGASAAVYAYQQPVATTGPQPADAQNPPGYVWAAADTEFCAPRSQGLTVNDRLWTLVYADNTRAEASGTGYDNFPKPGFPFGDVPLTPGGCVRGWITNAVRPDVRPTAVVITQAAAQPRWLVA
jgi:hypothetical protein